MRSGLIAPPAEVWLVSGDHRRSADLSLPRSGASTVLRRGGVPRFVKSRDGPLETGERLTGTMLRTPRKRFAAAARRCRIQREARHHSCVGSQYNVLAAPSPAMIATNTCAKSSRIKLDGSSTSIRSYQIGSSLRHGSCSTIAGILRGSIRPPSVG
jgi:hypothetical protein